MSKVKVIITDEDGDNESLWATHLGGDEYLIDNIPFFSYNVSKKDVVTAEIRDESLHVISVIRKSGHRTVWADMEPVGGIAGQTGKQFRTFLQNLGCSAEGFKPDLLAIDILPGLDEMLVIAELTRLGVEWEQADPQPMVKNDYAL